MGDGDIIRHRTENCGKFKRKMRNGGGHALTGQHRTGGESEGAGEGRKRGGVEVGGLTVTWGQADTNHQMSSSIINRLIVKHRQSLQ